MAFKKTLAHRLFNISKISNPTLTNCRLPSSSSAVQSLIHPNPAKFFSILAVPSMATDISVGSHVAGAPIASGGTKVIGEVARYGHCQRSTSIGRISPPATRSKPVEVKLLTVEDARKLLRVTLMETVKSKLRVIQKTYISFAEFVEICVDSCSNRDQGKTLRRRSMIQGLLLSWETLYSSNLIRKLKPLVTPVLNLCNYAKGSKVEMVTLN